MDKIDLVLSLLRDPKRSGDSGRQWTCICPAHDDTVQSLRVHVTEDDKILMNCRKGCSLKDVLRAINLEDSDLFPDENQKVKVTVGLLAWHKCLDPNYLKKECGLSDDKDGVCIPYYSVDAKRLATKKRTSLKAKLGSYWPCGVASIAYGLWKLREFRLGGKLIFVEGESDSWTLWANGYPAIGIPGSSSHKAITEEVIQNIQEIFVWQETDDGGADFVNNVANRLKELKWDGVGKVICGGPVKDPNALWQRDQEAFKVAFDAILTEAKPLPEPKKADKKKREKLKIYIPGQATISAEENAKIPPPTAGFYGLTDWGNAQRLVFRHGKDIRYSHTWGKWMVWTGKRWREDDNEEIVRLSTDTITSIYVEATKAENAELKNAITKHAQDSESDSSIRSMVRLARSEVGVPINHEEFDKDHWLFNCVNGTINLKTGELQPHKRDDYLTKISDSEYDADAKCPTWDWFLDYIMAHDKEMIRFLQLAIGYSLTAIVEENCFFFMYGSGANGKTTTINILELLLGNYWKKTSAETVLYKYIASTIPNDIARLVGVRMVSTAELPEGRQLDEAKIKDLTGRDTVTARFMRAEWFDFRPVFKLWMYGNHRPTIKNDDEGMWRRVRLIPFNVKIPEGERDGKLPDKLKAELPGILAWAVRGCLEWQRLGALPIPSGVQTATDKYRVDMDLIGKFLEDRCDTEPSCGRDENTNCGKRFIRVSDLYRNFESWCKSNGEYNFSQRVFSNRLRQKGYCQHIARHPGTDEARRWWCGISLRVAAHTTNGQAKTNNPISVFNEDANPEHGNTGH